jgi:ribosomal protein S18 acetylase RimI-like enzyme
MATTGWAARQASADELDGVAGVLARAFRDDPMWSWVLPGPDAADREARLKRFFDAVLGRAFAPHRLLFTAGDFAGAAVWAPPPHHWRIGLLDEARLAPPVLAAFGVGGSARLVKLQVATARRHLKEPHYYLFVIGADPAMQGRGVGASLLEPMLARCDAEKMPVYLESSNPANLSFYRRHGFEALEELRVGTAELTTMRRAPR